MEDFANSLSDFVLESIGVSLTEMAIQILSTILLFLIVKYFFWNNITEYLEKRKEFMASEYEDAKVANLEAISTKEKAELELTEIRLSAKGVIDDAKDRGELERTDIVKKAKKEARIVISNAQKEIDSEIEKARSNLNEEIVSVAVLMAEKVIKKEIDASKHKELISEVTKGVAS
ncbi:MAG: ATP synthase subunit b, sodium ion specific [Candidatus Izimaplasma bacterium HR2]|nr:MAG: ATP synthase subunit b, sodium ion specific [Candidatus Izimaplasma bacterium HR2]